MRFMVIVKASKDSSKGGFWMFQVASGEEAIEWVKRCPNPHPGESEIEIREVFEAEDFERRAA